MQASLKGVTVHLQVTNTAGNNLSASIASSPSPDG